MSSPVTRAAPLTARAGIAKSMVGPRGTTPDKLIVGMSEQQNEVFLDPTETASPSSLHAGVAGWRHLQHRRKVDPQPMAFLKEGGESSAWISPEPATTHWRTDDGVTAAGIDDPGSTFRAPSD
jgi:hypothetical protein